MTHYRDSIMDYDILNLEDFEFQSGVTLPNVKLAYKTYGKLNDDASNAVLLLHGISGPHEGADSVIIKGENMQLIQS